MNQRLVVLHGFAGRPDDWSAFDQSFSEWPLHKINLFSQKPKSFAEWADDIAKDLADFGGRQVLLGYSLGGRLAAHLLTRDPHLFSGAIFVSVNPGLVNEAEREERLAADQRWAEKWRSQPWNELQNEWNAQAVFQSPYSHLPERHEANFNRAVLGEAMTVWSLGAQADLREALSNVHRPQLWLAGQDDVKFSLLAEEMERVSDHANAVIVPQAGHRVPWDNPERFARSVSSFLESL